MLTAPQTLNNCFSTKSFRLLDSFSIDDFSSTPKHLQLVSGFLKAIESGIIKINDLVPSLNELKDAFDVSRDTAEKCYKYLRQMGILESVPGKGYYIRNVAPRHSMKILLLFNKLSTHKQIIYDSFVEILGEQSHIDFHVYNNDLSLFKKLLASKKEYYTHYVIMPHFTEYSCDIQDIINAIPKNKLLLLDKDVPGISGEYGAIFENFESDIYLALKESMLQLSKYHTLKIVYPANTYYPIEIVQGLTRFCRDYSLRCKVVQDLEYETIGEGEVFISLMEDDLVTLIERISELGLAVGRQVGVISYNETPLKKLVLDGITTISTDFKKMGVLAARMIVNKRREKIQLPFEMKLRASL